MACAKLYCDYGTLPGDMADEYGRLTFAAGKAYPAASYDVAIEYLWRRFTGPPLKAVVR